MALMARAHEVSEGENVLKTRGGAMSTKMVYGNDCNIMIAVRGAGYHSNPHAHDAEQLNYCVDGEIWCFVDDRGFLLKTGDFCRIPRNAVHWAWNRSDRTCTIFEAHAPACDPLVRKGAVGLYDPGETPDLATAVNTYRLPEDQIAKYIEVEMRVVGEAARS